MQQWATNRNMCFLYLGTVIAFLPCFTSLETDVNDKFEFSPQSETFKSWQKPDDPETFSVHFYNWTNPEDITNPDVKPKFEELGPYVYKMYTEKTNITWNHENQTVTYRNLLNFEFDEENSVGDESDTVTTIDFIALSVANQAKDWNYIIQAATKMFLRQSEIYVQKPVRQLLFEGYEDPILITMKTAMPFQADDYVDRFGWFYGRNGSVGFDGTFNMRTSPDSTFGTLQNWNYNSKTLFYEGRCADINGSAGELYPRNLNPDHIQFFSTKAYRTVQYNFEKNTDVKGIAGYRYTIGPETVDNGTLVEENKCFCTEKCLPSGVFNLSATQYGPLYLSLPHFYLGDSSYVNAVEGLKPEKNRHESYVTLEPKTGTQLDVTARVQINALLQPIEGFSFYENVTKVMFPILWYENKSMVADKLRLSLEAQ